MTRREWILCERTSRWAAAFRRALARENWPAVRIVELRNLRELTEQLEMRPNALILLEVNRANLAAALAFFADASSRHEPRVTAALLAGDLASPGSDLPNERRRRGDVIDALLEAGANTVTTSPRQLGDVLNLAQRHQKLLAGHDWAAANLPLETWAWSLLPWQDA
jgi:hypothetical protein